jgi:hypothetical protein
MCAGDNQSVEDEIAILRERQDSANIRYRDILSVVHTLMSYTLGGIMDNSLHLPSPSDLCEPTMLIRLQTETSRTEYSDTLGFQCSNWKFCKPAKSFEELLSQGLLTEEELQNHCESKVAPSN